MKKIIFRWIKVIIIIYCLTGILVYYLQDTLFFDPEPLPADHDYAFNEPFREVNIPYNKESIMNIVQFLPQDSAAEGVVLYFHGNKKNIARYAPYASLFTQQRYEVWMIDYPGFGKSTGQFTEDNLYRWALTFYKLARAHYSRDSIIIYGKSLGSGIAAQLASVRDCKALVLESPYYSFPSIVGSYLPFYPVNKIIRFKIPTWQYLQQVTAPVTIFHGTDDGVIPYRNARQLKPYLKESDVFISIPDGSHNDLTSHPLYQQKLDSLLKNTK